MVLPVKIFEFKEELDSGLMAQKLKSFHNEESYTTNGGETLNLVTEILDMKIEDSIISGIFSKDYMITRFYQRKIIETPATEESPFRIFRYQGRVFLAVLAPSVSRGVKKLLTGTVANALSRLLFITVSGIVEVKIPSKTLQDLHESNPQATKLIWFDQVDIPGVEKLCLAGSDVADTALYQDYLKHGEIWYVVFESKKHKLVIGITRSCVVTVFSKSTVDEFIGFILENIVQLIK